MKENGEREANVRGCSASEKKAQGWSFTFRPARTHTHTPLPDELPCFVTVVVLKWLCDGEKKNKHKISPILVDGWDYAGRVSQIGH